MINKYKSLAAIERRLEQLYDQGLMTSEEYVELEKQASKLAETETERQQKMNQALENEQKRIQNIKAQLLAGNVNVIDLFGIPEFGIDYELVLEGDNHVVYSRVAGPDQNDRHVLPTFDEANSKFRKLVWDRLYSKYVRTGDVGHLEELTQ